MLAPPLTPDPDVLPFLVVHGEWLWKVAVVVGAILGAVVWQHGRHRRARRDAHGELAKSSATVATMRQHELVLRGTLRVASGHRLATERFLTSGRYDEVAGSDETVAIVQGDGEVVLDGPIVVMSGTSARSSWRRRSIVSTLRDGDEVEAHGVGKLVPDLAEVGYRANPGVWRLSGDPVRLYAVKPRSLASPVGPRRAVATVAVGALVLWMGFHVAGYALGKRVDTWELPAEVGELDVIALAAALPSSRSAALEHYAWVLQHASGRENARRLVALADVMGQCDLANRVLMERHQWQALLERGRKCGNHEATFLALMQLGHVEDAADIAVTTRSIDPFLGGASLIAAGRWKEAAAYADAMARRWDSERAHDRRRHWERWIARTRYTCLAELFRWRDGEAAAAARLREHAKHTGVLECRLIASELLSGEERRHVLRDLSGEGHVKADVSLRTTSIVDALLWAEGGRKPNLVRDDVRSMRSFTPYYELLIAPLGIVARTEESTDWEDALVMLASWQLMRGDGDAALATASRLPPSVARRVRAAVALRRRDAAEHVDDEIDETRGAVLTSLRRGMPSRFPRSFVDGPCVEEAKRALAAAVDGDGRRLASMVGRCRLHSRAHEVFLAVGPRLRTGVQELASALIWLAEPDAIPRSQLWMFTRAAERRDLFRAIGAADEAVRWAEIADRHGAVLADRDRLVAIMLWNI